MSRLAFGIAATSGLAALVVAGLAMRRTHSEAASSWGIELGKRWPRYTQQEQLEMMCGAIFRETPIIEQTTAERLASQLKANHLALQERLFCRPVVVTGTVATIERASAKQAAITMSNGEIILTSSVDAAVAISRGQSVVASCRFVDATPKQALLDRCTFTSR